MKILAKILACCMVNSVISFPKPDGIGHGDIGHRGPTSAQTPTYEEDTNPNCKIIKSIDYKDEYANDCETVQVYELCIPSRPQECCLAFWAPFGAIFWAFLKMVF